MSRLAYRRDIDGLRALAVVLVVGYHFGATSITGGYIGVDVFFVISGFLIGSIFEREPKVTLALLAEFYRRRVQRLLPAFTLVALATALVATAVMLPEDLIEVYKSLRESFLFRANTFFARATFGYFAATTAELPWLHTWSLSVEWQFYFVFPLAMWLFVRLTKQRAQRASLLAATITGLVVSVLTVDERPADAYFSAAARAFEFTAGAFAAWTRFAVPRPRVAQAITAVCVVILLVVATNFTSSTPFPGVNGALVCGVAVVMLVVGRGGSILSFDAASFIGRRSYSMYLWHWPIVAFMAYVQFRPSAFAFVALAMLLVVLADLTYRFVERPGLAARWSFPTTLAIWCVAPLAVSATAYAFAGRNEGFPQRLGPRAERTYATLAGFPWPDADRCHGTAAVDLATCVLVDAPGRPRALLIGDSHARHFKPFVRVLGEQARVAVVASTTNRCLALEGIELPASFKDRVACAAANARYYREIRERRFDLVLIAQRWISYPAEQLERLDATLDTIVASGAIPILIESVAEDGTSPKDCFFRPIKLHRTAVDPCTIDAANPYEGEKKQEVRALIDRMRSRHPTLRVVAPQDVQCARGRCATVFDDTPIYGDTSHLNAFGSERLAHEYRERNPNPFERRPP